MLSSLLGLPSNSRQPTQAEAASFINLLNGIAGSVPATTLGDATNTPGLPSTSTSAVPTTSAAGSDVGGTTDHPMLPPPLPLHPMFPRFQYASQPLPPELQMQRRYYCVRRKPDSSEWNGEVKLTVAERNRIPPDLLVNKTRLITPSFGSNEEAAKAVDK
eukprot:gene22266-29338_t